MKICVFYLSPFVLSVSCNTVAQNDQPMQAISQVTGTWKLLTGVTIEKQDTTITDYTKKKSFIKIINKTHFAFMGHDLDKGKDSATALFTSGGGKYILKDSLYTEHLEYCSDRQWEGNDFSFTITIRNDTLVQQGVEKIESIDVNRINIEKYIRLND